MSDPQVSYPVREVLARMEAKLDRVVDDVHQLQLWSAARDAVGRSRLAIWTSGVAVVAAGSALLVAVVHH
jgi:hypothetical protein